MDTLTEEEVSSVFKLESQVSRPMELFDSLIMSLSFEMNLDQVVIERNIYTMLDKIADIGGFMSIIMGGISFILAMFNYKNFEYNFLTNFFKVKPSKVARNITI